MAKNKKIKADFPGAISGISFQAKFPLFSVQWVGLAHGPIYRHRSLVWLSGEVAEGPWLDSARFGSPFSSKSCDLWTLTATSSLIINETLKWFSSPLILMQESFWWWQPVAVGQYIIYRLSHLHHGFQARSKDQEILEEGGGAGPSLLPRRDHE